MTPTLPDLLSIQPFTRPARGDVILPGSKSLTNRALLLSALCDAPVTLEGALFSEDTHLMAEALRRLGFIVGAEPKTRMLHVSGQASGFTLGDSEIFVGLAGTAARFLVALCATAPRGIHRLDGVSQMRKRPMKPLIEALRSLGADVHCPAEEGFFPLEIHAHGLQGGSVSLDAHESSQLLSALLMVAPRAAAPIEITLISDVRSTFIEMTLRLMAEFGVRAGQSANGTRFSIAPARYVSPSTYTIEPDATAAGYFQALSLITEGKLNLVGLRPPASSLQGDATFAEVLHRTWYLPSGIAHSEHFYEISDTFLTLAAIAPLRDGPTTITGIAHTRKQETDRVAGMARELKKLGQEVIETNDALTIVPRPLQPGVEIETYGDHRFAMSFGILGCHDLHRTGRPWLAIKNPACCAKTFPNFFELLEEVRQKSLAP